MKAKHTPGPWHFIDTGPIRASGPTASLLANPSPHIHGVCEGISDADARLIAAAPELLIAVQNLLLYVETYGGDVTSNFAGTDNQNLNWYKNLIAKVRGE